MICCCYLLSIIENDLFHISRRNCLETIQNENENVICQNASKPYKGYTINTENQLLSPIRI
jgi:hypothetical protein